MAVSRPPGSPAPFRGAERFRIGRRRRWFHYHRPRRRGGGTAITRRHRATALRFARDGLAPLLALAVIAVLRLFDLSGDTPLPVIAAVALLGVLWQQEAVQRRVSGGDPHGRLALRIAVHLLQATTLMYMAGWGALLAVAHLHIFTLYLKDAGSRAWKPFVAGSVVSLALGECAYATGLLHGYLP